MILQHSAGNICFYGRMFEDFTDSIGSVDSFFPIFRFLINGFRFYSFFSDFVLLVSFICVLIITQ